MGESSIVSLVISAVGIFTIYLMAKATLRKDVERVTVLRFVEMFEAIIQGMMLCIDRYALLLDLCETPPAKQNLPARIFYKVLYSLAQEEFTVPKKCVSLGEITNRRLR